MIYIYSNNNFLQVLVSKHETTIESLNSDIQQQKANTRASEKNVLLLQEEKADLIKDICLMRDIISGKSMYILQYVCTLLRYNSLPSQRLNIIWSQESKQAETEPPHNWELHVEIR